MMDSGAGRPPRSGPTVPDGPATSGSPVSLAPQANSLDAQLVVRRGDFVLDVALRVESGEVVALLGPNGSGKSTLLAALAGLLNPQSGTVTVSGRTLTGSDRGIQVPPEHRGVGLLGQEPLLFPHLSAIDNIAFGQRSQGIRKQEALREAQQWLEAVGLDGYGRRTPGELSGGQQQRVAIARALAARPTVLLLDEPMAALDVQTAVLIRQLLREQLAASGTTAILVTHDVLDAIVLADRVAILHEGRIIDDGPKARILGQPRNTFIAALAGVNLVAGTSDVNGMLRLADGRCFMGSKGPGTGHAAAGASGPAAAAAAGTALAAVFRPSAVAVQIAGMQNVGVPNAGVPNVGKAHDELTQGIQPTPPIPTTPATVPNQWHATVVALEPSSGGIRIRTDDVAGITAELPPARAAELVLEPGQHIILSVAATEITIHRA